MYGASCNGNYLLYAMAVLSEMRGACIICVCVCGQPLLVCFLCRGCVRFRSGASYFPCLCVDKVLAMVNDAYESSLSKLCE